MPNFQFSTQNGEPDGAANRSQPVRVGGGANVGENWRFGNPLRMDSGKSKPAGGACRFGCVADRLGFGLILHAVAAALDQYHLGMVEQAVKNGRGDGAVVGEDGGPVLEGLVGGEDNRAALVTLADHLEVTAEHGILRIAAADSPGSLDKELLILVQRISWFVDCVEV